MKRTLLIDITWIAQSIQVLLFIPLLLLFLDTLQRFSVTKLIILK